MGATPTAAMTPGEPGSATREGALVSAHDPHPQKAGGG